jgi:hypothetical protein
LSASCSVLFCAVFVPRAQFAPVEDGAWRGTVAALAAAFTDQALIIEDMRRGYLWMPPAERNLGTTPQVKRKGR